MIRRRWVAWVLASALLGGCGSGGGGSDLLTGGTGGSTGGGTVGGGTGGGGGGGGTTPVTPPRQPGTLGALTDLGDLFAPSGDNWYFTQSAAINDQGVIVGQSNRGAPVKAAFSWNPGTGAMTYLGKHSGTYDDFYNLKTTPSDKFFIYSAAVGINGNGIVIGNSTTGTAWPNETEKRGFVFNGGFVDLTPPPYVDQSGKRIIKSFSEAVDISSQGYVVLTAEDDKGTHAYFWDGVSFSIVNDLRRDDNVLLPAFPVPNLLLLGRIVGADGKAVAINDNRQAVINSGGTAVFHDLGADVNDPSDDIIETLNHLPGATQTFAVDINNVPATARAGARGHIIGNSGARGFFWDGGAMYPIGTLGGDRSEVKDLNNNDVVVGNAKTRDGKTHAFRWYLSNGKGVIEDLGTLGGDNSYAVAINDLGHIIGYSETGEVYEEGGISVKVERAFLWANGVMYDLGTHNNFYNDPVFYPFVPSFPFSRPAGINAAGEVAGNSRSISEHPRGFKLTPVFPATP